MQCRDVWQILRNCVAASVVAAADDDYDVASDGNDESRYGMVNPPSFTLL